MSKKLERKRVAALKSDPKAYRREIPEGVVEVDMMSSLVCGETAHVAGRLMLEDRSGKESRFGVFQTVAEQDVICLERIEGNGASVPAYLIRTEENIHTANKIIDYGDVVLLEGSKVYVADTTVFIATSAKLLSKAIGDVYDPNIDFRKRSNLYAHRHLQLLREPDRQVLLRECSAVLRVMRQFLYAEGYDELNLTLLQEQFEAGLATPFVTRSVEYDRDLYLRLTAELFMRKLMIGGLSRVFEIGKSFRNQGSNPDSFPVFTILEMYCAYATAEEMEKLLERMIKEILNEVYGAEFIPMGSGIIDCSGDWKVYDFRELVEHMTGLQYDENLPTEELALVLDKMFVERPEPLNKCTIAQALYGKLLSQFERPAFLRNLPAAQSPLFKLNEDGSTVDETLLVINGMLVADIINAERDPEVMRKRLVEQATYRTDGTSDVNEDILHAMKFGLPPCRGIGMGIERLLMLLLNTQDIRDVEPFPVF